MVSATAKGIEGVLAVDDDIMQQMLIITFDDTKTSIDAIKSALKKAKYPISGDPIIIKK